MGSGDTVGSCKEKEKGLEFQLLHKMCIAFSISEDEIVLTWLSVGANVSVGLSVTVGK